MYCCQKKKINLNFDSFFYKFDCGEECLLCCEVELREH